MVILRYLVSAFIDAFGITHPSPGAREEATRYIASMVAAVILFVALVFWLGLRFM